MALTGDVDRPCAGKYVRLGNGVTEAAEFLFAYRNRIYRYLFNL